MGISVRAAGAGLTLLIFAGCGGGGGGNPSPPPSSYTPGVFQPSSGLAAQCAAPRTGTNPATGQPYPDRQGSVSSENNFLRSWTHELYLWYEEVPDLNPASLPTATYFDRLKTSATTPSGQDKDRFHFTFDTAEWVALSQSGVEIGYGARWAILSGTPLRIVVAYLEPDTPATMPGVNLTRGVEILSADGVRVIEADTQAEFDIISAALFPGAMGEEHEFEIGEMEGQRTITITAGEITTTPVQNVAAIPTDSGPVGYMLFNDHIATSEPALIAAVKQLRDAGIVDLVLDIRYNGGGFLDIASELAYMIGGNATAGRAFERMIFNDQHPTTDPVTRRPLIPMPFHDTDSSGQPLPTLDLPVPRVYVITGPDTCSASESIMNGLRGVDFEVYQIGSTTCGKPYGFYPQDNCGTTYFSIQFQGVNEKGFGEYPDGFSPANTAGLVDPTVPGCPVADDFTHLLGDELEGRLAAALAFRESSNVTCPSASGFAPGVFMKPGQPLSAAHNLMYHGLMYKSPARMNRILRER